MQTRILTTADAATWDGYLARLPGADVYHTAAYHAAHEANGDGTALCFVAEEGENLLLHPLMLREIPGTDWCDAESVYGYSGPLARVSGSTFLPAAWIAWEYRARKVIAEFIRFNPLSENEHWRGLHGLDLDRETVVLDLSGTADDLWQRYPKVQRNMVRKAERVGIIAHERSVTDLNWDLVRMCYEATMDRNGASDYYRFRPAYWKALEKGQSWCCLFLVQDKPVHGAKFFLAGAVFLLHGDRMHYHLAGSDDLARGTGAMNLLLHHAALWGQQHGYRWLHLGGGRTPAADDSLLRFKASISNQRLPFYTGRRIHNQMAYRQLCDEWRQRHPGQDGSNYFLLWRKA